MRMELGSEFSMEAHGGPVRDSVFHYLKDFESVYTDSGRGAIRLLEASLSEGAALLPSYICACVPACFPKRERRFYRVTAEGKIGWKDLYQKLTPDVSIVFLHYFNGVLPERRDWEPLRERKREYAFTIIEDTTHSLFSSPLTAGDYGVCSLRKWFPVPDGGVLYGPALDAVSDSLSAPCGAISRLRPEADWPRAKVKAMKQKAAYLAGGGEELNRAYRAAFAACDAALEEETEIHALSALSREILRRCSVEEMRSARRRNADFLTERLKRLLKLEPFARTKENECPLAFPIRVPERDALRVWLIARRIYCAVHWPLWGTELEKLDRDKLSERELSLPLDQRYGIRELSYLAERLEEYFTENRAVS